jgi:hypothetical protein
LFCTAGETTRNKIQETKYFRFEIISGANDNNALKALLKVNVPLSALLVWTSQSTASHSEKGWFVDFKPRA